jgi:hypothetical protein
MNESPTGDFGMYETIVDVQSNPLLLEAGEILNGIPMNFVEPGSFKRTVPIDQGPSAYKFPPLTFLFRSQCDPLLRSELQIIVEWMEPCSMVEFGGPIAREGSFDVNMETE